jgi:hypothetical protein
MTAQRGSKPLDPETCFDERRRNHRLKTRLDIVVSLRAPAGRPATVEKTTTENISSGDLYFTSTMADRIRVGDLLDVDITLPLQPGTVFNDKHLMAAGRVVRIGEAAEGDPDNHRGVAIVFLRPPTFRHIAKDDEVD